MLERKEIGQNGIEIKIPAEQDGTTYIFVLENEGDIFRSAISRDPEDNITILTTDYSFKTELTVAFILFIPYNSDRYKFNAIRINSISSLKKFILFESKVMSGYFDCGIKKDTQNYEKALEIINKYNIPKDILCDHELNDGYVRLKVVKENNINNIEKRRKAYLN